MATRVARPDCSPDIQIQFAPIIANGLFSTGNEASATVDPGKGGTDKNA